jgi:hypothetical protein
MRDPTGIDNLHFYTNLIYSILQKVVIGNQPWRREIPQELLFPIFCINITYRFLQKVVIGLAIINISLLTKHSESRESV